MKYNTILKYKKATRSINYFIYYALTLTISFLLAKYLQKPHIFFAGIAVGGVTAIPYYISKEKEIGEMEILLKLQEKLNKEEDN